MARYKNYMALVDSLYGDLAVKVSSKKKDNSEYLEQRRLVCWLQKRNIPCYHAANGGKRDIREAHHLKLMGVSPGVPDLCVPVARKGYHGLYIELKRKSGGKVSEAQKWWIKVLSDNGYLAVVANGCDEAIVIIEQYFS